MKGTFKPFRRTTPLPQSRWMVIAASTVLGILLGLVSPNHTAMAQSASQSASQSFSVTVPQGSIVQTPSQASVNATLDADEQSFPAQAWKIRSNSTTGLVVDFAVQTPFVHTEFPEYQMDTSLEVAVSSTTGAGQWTVPTSQSQTSFAQNEAAASVRVQTDNVGVADIALTVGVREANLTELLPGSYQSTVHVTIMPR